MSDAGDIVDAIVADLGTAVAGITTSKEAVAIDQVATDAFPYATILQTDYDVELLDFLQEQRQWLVSGAIYQEGGTRDDIQTKLEAFRDQVAADNTLGGAVDRATVVTAVPDQHPDAQILAGVFAVQALKVV